MYSHRFLKEERYYDGKANCATTELWFAPFLVLKSDGEYDYHQIVKVSLEQIRSFIGSKQSNKNLKQAILQAFVDIENAYVVPKNERPFRLKKVEKGYAYFQLEDFFVFSGFYRKQFNQICLNEIASYRAGKLNYTIPLLFYCLSHRHKIKDDKKWEIEFGDRQLKRILGMSKYDYLNIPDNQRVFYEWYDKRYTSADGFSAQELQDGIERFGFSTTKEMMDKYFEVDKDVTFLRWHFEKRVLLPAIKELNQGSMVRFAEQDVWKRGKANEPASKVKSYIGKNYEMLPEGRCVIVNEQIIDKNITNFNKLVRGRQYRFIIY